MFSAVAFIATLQNKNAFRAEKFSLSTENEIVKFDNQMIFFFDIFKQICKLFIGIIFFDANLIQYLLVS